MALTQIPARNAGYDIIAAMPTGQALSEYVVLGAGPRGYVTWRWYSHSPQAFDSGDYFDVRYGAHDDIQARAQALASAKRSLAERAGLETVPAGYKITKIATPRKPRERTRTQRVMPDSPSLGDLGYELGSYGS